jgi:hypothetical protein
MLVFPYKKYGYLAVIIFAVMPPVMAMTFMDMRRRNPALRISPGGGIFRVRR